MEDGVHGQTPRASRRRARAGGVDAIYSMGLRVGADGDVQDSLVGGPAYLAGITQGMRVMAVNDRAYTPDVLHDAMKASTKNRTAHPFAGLERRLLQNLHGQLPRR